MHTQHVSHAGFVRPTLALIDKTANQTMLFGPLGPSLAPYVRSSRTLSKWFKPLANWYANLSGYRRVGLVYDDLRASSPNSAYHPTIVLCWYK